ncbi:hypothetical protein P691DRAFT_667119 [Macrolepiota fuliginosa MF-IS2]|uniref:DUF6533 domain-containing protein n=1 Tax=Macrolepiota fuliginosa MF-IS2 TaxID=1400762 RepID=A0A9P5XI26_9AGAR|nr:hypothetical protein P691DRAFT_667119 [Macrolepiota fuliginosa MF-IS2]
MGVVQIRQYSNVAGLAVLVYDQILTWEQEVQYIWSGSDIFVKSSYCLSRYLALIIQIVGIIHSSPSVLLRRKGNCLPWFTFQVYTTYLLLWNLELVMMTRVYALYGRTPPMGALLVVWFIISRVLNIWSGMESLKGLEPNLFCTTTETPEDSKWFSLTVVINQFLLWVLTYYKYRSAVREGWSKHPIVRVVVRDNLWVFIILSGIIISLLPYSLYIQQVGNIVFR